MGYLEDGEFYQFIDVYPDGTFENSQKLRRYSLRTLNSVYIMDHDSEGRCYCKWQLRSLRI